MDYRKRVLFEPLKSGGPSQHHSLLEFLGFGHFCLDYFSGK